jgi:hypothetical protein
VHQFLSARKTGSQNISPLPTLVVHRDLSRPFVLYHTSTYSQDSITMLALRSIAAPVQRQCWRAAPRAAVSLSLQVRQPPPHGCRNG